MSGIWLPQAKHVDLTHRRGNGPFERFLGVILHVNADQHGTTDSFYAAGTRVNPDSVTPNFQVYKDGRIHQYLPLNWQPWTQRDGNFNYASIETAGLPSERLTAAQIASCARIVRAYRRHMGMVLAIADSPGHLGLGTHKMGGAAWGGHPCPGHLRAAQRRAILAAAGRRGSSPAPTESADQSSVHASSLGLSASQFANAHGILRAAKVGYRLPAAAGVIAIETALVESGMRMLASANVPASQRYPHDLLNWTSDGLGHDHASMGMFQQQTGWKWTPAGHGWALNQTTMPSPDGWGPPHQLMNAERSTHKFLNALVRKGWQGKTRWQAAQDVQGSAFADGSNYRSHDARAQQIVHALWPTIGVHQEVDMLIVQDSTTGRRYVLVPGRPVMAVTKPGARAYAALFGLSTTYPKRSHAALKAYDARMRSHYSGVK